MSFVSSRALPSLLVVLMGCAEAPIEDGAGVGVEPAVGKADGSDKADRECRVVLDGVGRIPSGPGYESVSTPTGSWYVWAGAVHVAPEALAAGYEPRVLYRSGGQWREVGTTPLGERDVHGMERYAFRIERDTASPGWGLTTLDRYRMSVIPYLVGSGQRWFDHNRRYGAMDAYELDLGNGWSVQPDPTACAPVHAATTLRFRADGSIERAGELAAGGTLTVDYDLARLASCRHTTHGRPLWHLDGSAKFEPFLDETVSVGKVEFPMVGGLPETTGFTWRAATVRVPRGATQVQLWFHNWSDGAGCDAYDSLDGDNHRYPIP